VAVALSTREVVCQSHATPPAYGPLAWVDSYEGGALFGLHQEVETFKTKLQMWFDFLDGCRGPEVTHDVQNHTFINSPVTSWTSPSGGAKGVVAEPSSIGIFTAPPSYWLDVNVADYRARMGPASFYQDPRSDESHSYIL